MNVIDRVVVLASFRLRTANVPTLELTARLRTSLFPVRTVMFIDALEDGGSVMTRLVARY